MSTLESARERERPISEIGKAHQRDAAVKLAEWGYVYTGMDGKSAAMMVHPAAGVVRLHCSPNDREHKEEFRRARQQLAAIGITVTLPEHAAHQPKKEKEVSIMTQPSKKTRLTPSQNRARQQQIRAYLEDHGPTKATELAEQFGISLEYLTKLRKRIGIVVYVERKWQGSAIYALPHQPRPANSVLRAGKPIGGEEPTSVVPPVVGAGLEAAGIEAASEEGGHVLRGVKAYRDARRARLDGSEELGGDQANLVDPRQELSGEPDVVAEMPPAPAPESETPEAPEPAPDAALGLPAALVDSLREHFTGDLTAENDLLREALSDVVGILQKAAQDAAATLEALGEGTPARRRPSQHYRQHHSSIGIVRSQRLEKLFNVMTDEFRSYKDLARATHDLTEAQAGNALSAALRKDYTHEGYRVERGAAGMYRKVAV